MQTVPQVPQFFESDARFASHPFAGTPSQLLKPGEQLTTAHVPWTHAAVDACASAQLEPQPLQFCGSYCVFVHRPAQFVSPGGQEQTPPAQAIPVGQVAPHRPQFCGSYEAFVQTPAQSVCPVGHAAV
ncbi:MAG TPA: hypothetical protein VK841_04675 [Polyangiaceae bacterium]|nr:hypothetical protein [Polyangiaceae bacterium]